MTWVVENPTPDDKAVRAAGGLVVVPAGAAVRVDEDWSYSQRAAYAAAGLVVRKGEASDRPDEVGDADLREAVADILAEIGEEEGGDGVPNMDVVRAALVEAGVLSATEAKRRVTAGLRDAVWSELQG